MWGVQTLVCLDHRGASKPPPLSLAQSSGVRAAWGWKVQTSTVRLWTGDGLGRGRRLRMEFAG
jgi:hypothetical protein